MGKIAGRFVILLDMGRVLSVDELAMLSGLPGSADQLALAA